MFEAVYGTLIAFHALLLLIPALDIYIQSPSQWCYQCPHCPERPPKGVEHEAKNSRFFFSCTAADYFSLRGGGGDRKERHFYRLDSSES